MAKAKPDNYILQQRTARADYEPDEGEVPELDPSVMALFPGYKESLRRRDFIPEPGAEPEVRISKFQEKYGLEAEEGKPIPKRGKVKTGFLDPRNEH